MNPLLLGAKGCWIYTSSEAVVSAPQVGNIATLPLAIPNIPSLGGVQVFLPPIKLDVARAHHCRWRPATACNSL